MNDTMQRQSKFQSLIRRHREDHPADDYQTAFAAVSNSDEGQQLMANMHIANADAVPVFNPRSARLVGLSYPQDEAIFRETWLRKQGPLSGGGPYPKYPDEAEEQRRTDKASGGGPVVDEPALKEKGKSGFLSEVNRLIQAGHEYSAAWSIAGSTSPGKEFYAQWSRGSAQLKGSGGSIAIDNSALRLRQQEFAKLLREREEAFPGEGYSARFQFVCNSDAGRSLVEMMGTPEDPSERFNPATLADAEKKFAALEQLLPHEKGFTDMSQADITGYLQTKHPEGKKLYATILKQKALKLKEEAIQKVKLGLAK